MDELVRELQRASPTIGVMLEAAPRVHLAVMRQPWAGWIEEGSKVVESRWSRGGACLPHLRVAEGDVVVWKHAGGRVFGASPVRSAYTTRIRSPAHAAEVYGRWAPQVRVNPRHAPARAEWATFVVLADPSFVPLSVTVPCGKRDRSGWALLVDRTNGKREEVYP